MLDGPTAADSHVEPRGGRPLADASGRARRSSCSASSRALAWGAGDFGGGTLARRAPVLGVVLGTQLVGLVLALALGLARGEPFPQGADLGWAVARASPASSGSRRSTAASPSAGWASSRPTTGVLAAVIPVVVGFVAEGMPRTGRRSSGSRSRSSRSCSSPGRPAPRGRRPAVRARVGAARRHDDRRCSTCASASSPGRRLAAAGRRPPRAVDLARGGDRAATASRGGWAATCCRSSSSSARST